MRFLKLAALAAWLGGIVLVGLFRFNDERRALPDGPAAQGDPATVEATVDAFFEAASEGEIHEMLTYVSDATRPASSVEFGVRLDGLLSGGGIDAVTLTRDDAEITDRGAGIEVPYTVTYGVPALGREVAVSGLLPLVESGSGWLVEWSRSVLWGRSVDDAHRFALRVRWPRRAAILDRDGRTLARGHGDRRVYPFDALAGPTVGHLERSSAAADEPVAPPELTGASGLEQGLDERLAGDPDVALTIVDRAGRPVQVLGERQGTAGEDVTTTLDVDVQRAAEAGFGSTTGGAVVVDPRSGDILAVVSSGAFDPGNYLGTRLTPFNRALSGLYPPGSSLKVVTAAAALETGVVDPSTPLTGPSEYRGVRNFESGEFGRLDFATAVKYSVNTAFAQVALELGGRRLTRFAQAFGFNAPLRMPLDAATSSFPPPEDEGDLMWGSIGQAQVLATPLQMASVAATVANGGLRMEPRITTAAEKDRRRVVARRTAKTLAGLMEEVVEGGTGTAAGITGVRVAGKTGTAEVDIGGERRNHAWFVCFAPVEDPRVALAVVSEYGGVGGQVAAPLARSILEQVLPLLE